MGTVTYKNQPAIHKTRGTVPVQGTEYPYTVTKVLWPPQVEGWLESRMIGKTLHICSGNSLIGNVRLDMFSPYATVKADAARVPFADKSFDTVICDPPYNSVFQWMHDMLNELHRLARVRILFQHWFSPIDKDGQFKKANVYKLTSSVVVPEMGDDVFELTDLRWWMPRTYFGRVQLISEFTHQTFIGGSV